MEEELGYVGSLGARGRPRTRSQLKDEETLRGGDSRPRLEATRGRKGGGGTRRLKERAAVWSEEVEETGVEPKDCIHGSSLQNERGVWKWSI